MSRMRYRTIAACAVPARRSSTQRALLASPMVAMLPNTQNAAAQAAAMIWYCTLLVSKKPTK
ncbi:MAG TPA: hypothetical protein VH589_20480 [Trebonia sp.]